LFVCGSAQAVTISQQHALLDKYCVVCHNERTKTAGVMFDKLDLANVAANAEIWEKVIRKVRTNMMPPAGLPRPDKAASDAFLAWLESALDTAAAAKPNPGRTETFHRLNRAEYQNAIRDLLAMDIDASELLPTDDASYGFDNIAGVLKMPPVLMERYTSASQKISRVAVGSMSIPPTAETFRVQSELNQYDQVDGMPFGTRGGTRIHYTFPLDAEYEIQLKLARDYTDVLANFYDRYTVEVSIDGQRVRTFTFGGDQPRPDAAPGGRGGGGLPRALPKDIDVDFHVRIPVKAGPRDVLVTFIKKTSALPESEVQLWMRPSIGAGGDTRYEPHIASVTISGPFDARGPGDTPSRRRIFVCRPAGRAEEAGCATQIFSTLARRAYRRPPTQDDIQTLLSFYHDGREEGGFDSGIEMGLRRLLVSPSFLFRIERDPTKIAPATAYRISDLELASRLSFFLWSSTPDDELLDLAIRGKLSNSTALEHQVRRMLADARSGALVENFTGQWLYLRNLASVRPDQELFPNFDDNLRAALQRETETFFESLLRENRSALDLLRANYTFVNERLARHYGIPNIYGDQFRRISLPDDTRVGLLGQGSILTVTSSAIRTSPVLRGKWILENLLGVPPPPPPANVPPLKENTEGMKPLSVRERLEEHRKDPACASCHKLMDPLGLSLENYDAVGAWRAVSEAGTPIDASGQLTDGTKINGVADLRAALLARPDNFVITLTEKLMTYALGRGIEYYDAPAIRKIARDTAAGDYKLSSLIMEIIKSTPFQMRRSQS
jgi:hypothetical protein